MCPYNACEGNDTDCWCFKEQFLTPTLIPARFRRSTMPEEKYESSRCDLIPEAFLTTPARAKRRRRQARELARGGPVQAHRLVS